MSTYGWTVCVFFLLSFISLARRVLLLLLPNDQSQEIWEGWRGLLGGSPYPTILERREADSEGGLMGDEQGDGGTTQSG